MRRKGRQLGIGLAITLLIIGTLPTRAQSDSERLEKLERAVELLQKRNAELEHEVRSLKSKPQPPVTKTATASSKTTVDGKEVIEQAPVKEEKKSVTVTAAASELKLSLGGYIQVQGEAGDVFAFEGRFGSGSSEIKDRFRIRRARIGVVGDYAEQFDFKVEGDFSLNDTALTVRDANGRTLASNSTRTTFSATDIFVNWHRYPELNVRVGQWKAPFGFEQLTPDAKLFTAERSLVTTSLTPERQIGLMVWGKPFTNLWPEERDLLTYYAGDFNGTGRNISVNDNNEFM